MKKVLLSLAACLLLVTTMIFASNYDPPSISPINGDYKITAPFGMRMHPILKEKKMHKGLDLVGPTGTPVVATADGEVLAVTLSDVGHGNHIIIRHDDQYRTLYASLTSDIEVEEGQEIKMGEVIGYIGQSGASTGPHLHYEVIKDGEHQDPERYIGL